MTATLYPTPTRIRRLRLVRAGEVAWESHATLGPRAVVNLSGSVVTSAMEEMEQAGWVTIPHGGTGPVTITDAGRAILENADGDTR